MNKTEQLKKKITSLENKIKETKEELRQEKGKTLVECTNNCYGKGCGKKKQIKNLVYIRTFWFRRGLGYEDDSWNAGEGNFDCPNCGHRNRLYDRPEIQELKDCFSKIMDEYEKIY